MFTGIPIDIIVLLIHNVKAEILVLSFLPADQDPLSEEIEAQFLMIDHGALPPKRGSIVDLLKTAQRREGRHLLERRQPKMGLTTVMVLERRVEALLGMMMIGNLIALRLMGAAVAAAPGTMIGALLKKKIVARSHLSKYFSDK